MSQQQQLESLAQTQRQHLRFGLAIVFALVAGLGGWAALANINGAVIAAGTVIVEGNIKKVQHQEGGIVGQILVKNGDSVSAGAPLLRLDDTVVAANLAVVKKQLLQYGAHQSRLQAEWQKKQEPAFGSDLLKLAEELPSAAATLNGQRQLMQARSEALQGRKQQLSEQVAQLNEQIEGLKIQRDAKARGLELVRQQLADFEALFVKRLVSESQVIALKRQETDLAGEHGALISRIAQTKQSIGERNLQILQLDQDFLQNVLAELQQVDARIAELEEQRIAGEDRLRRVEVRAPRSGIVHQLNVHTIGGVINAAEPLMMIVPEEAKLVVEARVLPMDRDQVKAGQAVVVRIPAFDQRTTPELFASVERVAADLEQDPVTGEAFYRAMIAVSDAERARLNGQQLLPGLPVETFIQTGSRSALSYFVKPLKDQFAHAMREN
ncbi:HlyD family type I secretion periplasmic adaptor subunit [Polycladidibacter hongkongensis]|uniref:HlyD family type I secretion periplasmic adaptor subunit n=1 Tax=Polycladidibacter hongkongensis TaxID=1647556 RepID=UPI0008308C7D|nr:HlyD family type I secretion periplasmic adaptor subunit [Pseudovibrio hongkongensis]